VIEVAFFLKTVGTLDLPDSQLRAVAESQNRLKIISASDKTSYKTSDKKSHKLTA